MQPAIYDLLGFLFEDSPPSSEQDMASLRRFRVAAILTVMFGHALGLQAALAAGAGSPTGYWLTESRDGVIELAPCGSAICGKIVGISRGPNEAMPVDVHGRSQCGLTIITNEIESSPGVWTGSVTDPRDGSTYGAKIWVDEDDRLHLRGYLGIPLFGQTQIWTRYTGHLSAECRFG
jgi:uncharacterized protein (DUF2147 family)